MTNRLLIKIGTIGMWISTVLIILGLLIAMWAAVWSWPSIGTLVLLVILSITIRIAGGENWFELND